MQVKQMFLAWTHWGCEYVQTETEKRKVFNTNIASLLALISISFYTIILQLTNNSVLMKSAFGFIPFYALFIWISLLNRSGQVVFSRWLLSLILPLLIHLMMLLGQGSYLSLHYYFLLFGLVPTMFFPLKSWIAVFSLFLLNITSFIIADMGYYPIDLALLNLKPWMVMMLSNLYILTTFLTLLIIVWLSEYAAYSNEIRLEGMSLTDSLTNIANRRKFDEVFQREWRRSLRESQPLTVAIVDVDWFKDYNDHYGHQAGDSCLQEVAEILQTSVSRSSDLVARYGGEEFVILISNANSQVSIELMERVCAAFEERNLLHAASAFGFVTVSIGIASVIPKKSIDSKKLIEESDKALYKAKNDGKNQVAFCELDDESIMYYL